MAIPLPRSDMDTAPTPRETRHRLLKMERWYRRHAERFTPEDQVFLRLAFEYAEKPADADMVAEAIQKGLGRALGNGAR